MSRTLTLSLSFSLSLSFNICYYHPVFFLFFPPRVPGAWRFVFLKFPTFANRSREQKGPLFDPITAVCFHYQIYIYFAQHRAETTPEQVLERMSKRAENSKAKYFSVAALVNQNEWEPNGVSCMICQAVFTLFRRPHHWCVFFPTQIAPLCFKS